jgi:hypothetical protein
LALDAGTAAHYGCFIPFPGLGFCGTFVTFFTAGLRPFLQKQHGDPKFASACAVVGARGFWDGECPDVTDSSMCVANSSDFEHLGGNARLLCACQACMYSDIPMAKVHVHTKLRDSEAALALSSYGLIP